MTLSPSSPAKTLARGPFVGAIAVVYALSFVSQTLLSPPVTAVANVVPFLLAQAVLIAIWIALHRRRLRDAGRPTGAVVGVASVYAVEIVLIVLLTAFFLQFGGAGEESGKGLLYVFILLYLLGQMSGSGLSGAQLWFDGLIILLLLPVIIALIFSLWAATRPGVSAGP